jgi:hypothetical protein
MKACWLLCTLVLSLSCLAQTSSVRLYGFNQPVLKGVPSTYETDEEGKKVEPKVTVQKNIFIYLTYPPALKLYLTEVWVKGELYNVKQVPVTTPVDIVYDNGQHESDKVTLVPYTTDTVIQLVLIERPPAKNSVIKKSLTQTNDVIVAYKLNGKLYTQLLKKIKGLRTAMLQ